jgi:hypothetical protein
MRRQREAELQRSRRSQAATVMLEDGRVFNTENGGVTWSTP